MNKSLRKVSQKQQQPQKKATQKIAKKSTRKLHTKTTKKTTSNFIITTTPSQYNILTATTQQQHHSTPSLKKKSQTQLSFQLTPLTSLISSQRRFQSTKIESATAAPLSDLKAAATDAKIGLDHAIADAKATITESTVTAAIDSATQQPAATDAKPKKQPGKMRQLYNKYGKLAVYSYLGIYIGGMVVFPLITYCQPVFDSTDLVQWCRDNDHGVWAMDWVSKKLDEHPSLGEKVRANPKLSVDIGAGMLINELLEPLRIAASVPLMQYLYSRKQAALGLPVETEGAATADATVAAVVDDGKPAQVTATDIKEAKVQQQSV